MSTKSSGFGARRQLNFIELPFAGKTFYTDVKSSSLKAKIIHRIQSLGGQVETFLSKDISLFITDREDKHGSGSPEETSGKRKSFVNTNVPLSRGKKLLNDEYTL